MIFVLLAIVGAVALGVALLAVGRPARGDDVERFHRARQMTTEWSRRYAAGHAPVPSPSPELDACEPEPAEHR